MNPSSLGLLLDGVAAVVGVVRSGVASALLASSRQHFEAVLAVGFGVLLAVDLDVAVAAGGVLDGAELGLLDAVVAEVPHADAHAVLQRHHGPDLRFFLMHDYFARSPPAQIVLGLFDELVSSLVSEVSSFTEVSSSVDVVVWLVRLGLLLFENAQEVGPIGSGGVLAVDEDVAVAVHRETGDGAADGHRSVVLDDVQFHSHAL
mmetsp:Transcript_17027/g.51698  ORF Transcript_17027/g.51698 Transcript_17027/m.51698 type:complete len:204 (-) Transcript_17027:151-762(-)